MKRLCCLAALMLLSSSAYAGHSFSFVVGGHRVRIEAPRHCFSRSCVSVSIPGIYESRRRRDWPDEVEAAPATAPPPAPAAEQVSSRVVAPPANKPAVEPVASAAPPPTVGLAAAATQQTAAPPPPTIQPRQPFRAPQVEAIQIELPPIGAPRIEPARVETPVEPARPAAEAAPKPSTVAQKMDDESFDTPLGDWQTEGKGSVRIERCGSALCGYLIDPSSRAKGEAVLVNMKLKTGSLWTGNVYSQNSADSYYGTLAMKGPHTLRVEACALGRFYCSGNNWSRIDTRPERLISSRPNASASGS
jgi:uncharacterized protein (DUF2147 family)